MLEIIRPRPAALRVAMLDFDGTLSLVRGGWQQVLLRLMLEALSPLAPDDRELERRATDAIDALTGHPTIHQLRWLADEVARLGGRPDAPEIYAAEYQASLGALVERRLGEIAAGHLAPDALMVPGARAFLDELRRRDVLLVLASGTEERAVRREAAALGIDAYFGARVHGPGPHDPHFTKRAVVERLLAEGHVGASIVAVGDGPVEIREARAAGGYAVGVALDEARGSGIDQRKRAALTAAGADLIVPDLAAPELAASLFDDAPAAGATSREATHALPDV